MVMPMMDIGIVRVNVLGRFVQPVHEQVRADGAAKGDGSEQPQHIGAPGADDARSSQTNCARREHDAEADAGTRPKRSRPTTGGQLG